MSEIEARTLLQRSPKGSHASISYIQILSIKAISHDTEISFSLSIDRFFLRIYWQFRPSVKSVNTQEFPPKVFYKTVKVRLWKFV